MRFAVSRSGPTGLCDPNKDYNGNSEVGFPDLILFAAVYNMTCGNPDLDLAP